jgi:multisubunit Na+/H+ antiporter MnhB subunit
LSKISKNIPIFKRDTSVNKLLNFKNMSNDSGGGFGGCLVTILVILVFLAAFGFVNWSTVGSFARFIVYFIVAGIILLVIIFLWSSSNRN